MAATWETKSEGKEVEVRRGGLTEEGSACESSSPLQGYRRARRDLTYHKHFVVTSGVYICEKEVDCGGRRREGELIPEVRPLEVARSEEDDRL